MEGHMPNIHWNKAFSVGFAELDIQHQKWFELYNTARTRAIQHDQALPGDVIAQFLTDMRAYSNDHFVYEEEYMLEIGYPDAGDHQKIHQAFDAKISEYQNALDHASPQMTKEILDFIQHWLLDHVANEDRKYCSFAAPR